MISDVAKNLEAMNQEQYVLAFVFVSSYAYALGEFIGVRGRRIAVAATVASATAFAALSNPWEYGIMVVALALAGMGFFVAACWTFWTLASWRDAHAAQRRPVAVEIKPKQAAAPPLGWRRRMGLRSI